MNQMLLAVKCLILNLGITKVVYNDLVDVEYIIMNNTNLEFLEECILYSTSRNNQNNKIIKF